MLTAPDDDDPAPAPAPTRSAGHAKRQSSLAGLKPFLLAGLLVVIGLLIGLNFLLDGSGDVSTNSAPTPGAITIGPPPGQEMKPPQKGPEPPGSPASPSTAPSTDSTTAGKAPTTPSEFTFYETLKKPPHDPAATVGLTPSKAAPPKSAEAPAASAASPKPAPAKHGVIETTTAQNGKFRYTIQVGAFRQQSVADGLIAKLNKKGHDAYLVTASSPNGDGTTYRVRVGRFATHEEADRTAKQLAATEKLHPFITTIGPETEKKG